MPKPSGRIDYLTAPPASRDPIAELLGKSPEQQDFWNRVSAFHSSQDYGGLDDTGVGIDAYLREEERRQRLLSYLRPYLEATGLYQNVMAPPPQNMMRGMFGLRQRNARPF
jgi:hypothetical protein